MQAAVIQETDGSVCWTLPYIYCSEADEAAFSKASTSASRASLTILITSNPVAIAPAKRLEVRTVKHREDDVEPGARTSLSKFVEKSFILVYPGPQAWLAQVPSQML